MLTGYTGTSQDPRVHAQDDSAFKSYEYPMNGFRETVEMHLSHHIRGAPTSRAVVTHLTIIQIRSPWKTMYNPSW